MIAGHGRARYHRPVKIAAPACLAMAALLGGCSLLLVPSIDPNGSEEPADFRGDYGLQVTNGDNGCDFANWTVGAVTPDVPIAITQTDDQLTGELGGWWQLLANLIIGNDRATGNATGSHMSMTLVGTNDLGRPEGCPHYEVNALFEGDLAGDFLTGTATYTAVTNDPSAACDALEGCESVQDFNGARPPR
jgi:hypothetical protein